MADHTFKVCKRHFIPEKSIILIAEYTDAF